MSENNEPLNDSPQEQPDDSPQEQPDDSPQEQTDDSPQEQPDDSPQEQTDDSPQEQSGLNCITYNIEIHNITQKDGKLYYLYKIDFNSSCLGITKTYFGEKVLDIGQELVFDEEELKNIYNIAKLNPKILMVLLHLCKC
jgi:hypothetical protein